MEHGSLKDTSASTFSIVEEDHTLANSVRFVLNQEVQNRNEIVKQAVVGMRWHSCRRPSKGVLKDALQDLMFMCQHIRGTFDNAVADYRSNNSAIQMDIDPKQK